ncbi:MAG TPA: hypothetical protein VG898_12480 [Solirubrobacterales bacterium]|nr:hypothetical protein [Solirubrobacterales bacterium]
MAKTRGGSAVHRPLHLTSPLMHGADVEALQAALKKLMRHYKIGWLPLAVDGKLGRQTLHVARFLAWVLGLGNGHRSKIRAGTIPIATQRILRDPKRRGRLDRLRERRRRPRLRQIRERQTKGPKATMAYARACVGITENPAGSNTGPLHKVAYPPHPAAGISYWESYWHLTACYWCLVWACFCVREIGGAKIPGPDQAYLCVNAAEILRQARARENGWVLVPLGEEREGDVSLWCFDGSGVPDHGELVEGPYDLKLQLSNDIGGNTSSGSAGSQSNGGGVFRRHDRPLSQLSGIARPLYS